MKNLFLLTAALFSFNAQADIEIVPLDIELGYWESTIEIQENSMMDEMLAGIPEEQRAMVRQMMQKAMPKNINQCVTQESLNNMEEQLKKNIGSKADSCAFKITKSTSQILTGEMNCDGAITAIKTEVENSKRNITNVVGDIPGQGKTKLKITSEYKSASCPN